MGSIKQSASRHTSTTSSTMIFRPLLMCIVVVFLFYFSRAARVCSDGSAPTCADGSIPTRDMNRATPPCPGQGRGRQGKPNTCPDGQPPTKQRQNGKRGGQRGGRGRRGPRCPKSSRICCDGSTPNFGEGRSSQCQDGKRAKCSQSQCPVTG